MSLYAGIDVQSTCTPEMAERDAFILDCGGTLTNPGPQTLYVVATEASTSGGIGALHAYTLPPGGPVVQLSTPADGYFWVVLVQSVEQLEARGAWRLLGSLALYGLAGWGAGSIVAGIIGDIRNRRR